MRLSEWNSIFEPRERLCSFGISEIIGAVLVSAGVGAATAATVGTAVGGGLTLGAVGAGGGALIGGIEGGAKGALKGAESGGITGLGIGAGEVLGPAAGIGATAGGALGGAAGGALGAEATGGNLLRGAGLGAVSGGVAGFSSSGGFGGAPPGGSPPGVDAGAGATAAGAPVTPVAAQTLGAADVSTALSGGSGVAAAGSAGADIGSVGPGSAGGSLTATPLGPIGGGPEVLTSGGGAPVFTGAGASPPTGSVPISLSPGSNLSGTEAGFAGELAAQGSNPAGSAIVDNATQAGNAGAPAAGGGILSGSGTKLALAAAPAALALLRGEGKVPSNIQPLTTGGAVTGPLIATENQQLNEANSGVLQPGQAAQISQYSSSAESQLRQQLANEGVADPTKDSRYIAGMATISQNAQIMSQQFITGALTSGLSAAGDAASALTTAANAQLAVDQEFQSALNSATQSFGLIMGLGGITKLAA